MFDTLKTLIIEDDLANAKLLQILLDKYCPNIEVIGHAKNNLELIDLLLTTQPDLLLLDIDLGEEKNSLETLKELDTTGFEIIITTSHDEFAVKAINQYQVSRYLLKPIKALELTKAITSVTKKIAQKKEQLQQEELNNGAERIIGIPTTSSIEIIEVKNIIYLEADGKYTVFYLTDGSSKVTSKNIGSYEKLLPHNLFFRIHHRYMVNVKMIANISRSDGNYCQLNNGKSLSIAKRRREEFRKFLHLK